MLSRYFTQLLLGSAGPVQSSFLSSGHFVYFWASMAVKIASPTTNRTCEHFVRLQIPGEVFSLPPAVSSLDVLLIFPFNLIRQRER